MVDIRCTSVVPESRRRDAERCQLLAGHEGPHALMYAKPDRRCVKTWRDSDPRTVRDDQAEQPNLPWVRGMPVPAWRDST